MSYTMRDEGYDFKKIYHGKQWVGRVIRHADKPFFIGIIQVKGSQPLSVQADTERGAFEEVCARAMGYATAAALHARNATVRAAKRRGRQHARQIANQILYGTTQQRFAAIDAMLGIKKD
jgi:hypothetical protein